MAGPHLDQALDFGMLIIGPEVEVDAVLDDSLVVDPQEDPLGPAPAGAAADIAVVVDVVGPAQRL